MPAIDSDIFQFAVLVLLGAILIAAIASLAALNSIKKELASPARSSAADVAPQQRSDYGYSTPQAGYQPSGATQTASQPEATTGFVSVAESVGTAPASDPGYTAPAAQPVATSGGPALRGDEPEEQPFERDGRWWFKRGDELLVYDEGTGQWVAAPGGAGISPAPAETGYGVTPGTGTAVSATETGEGWKCSSCGAINGSTATSCRMCFAPR